MLLNRWKQNISFYYVVRSARSLPELHPSGATLWTHQLLSGYKPCGSVCQHIPRWLELLYSPHSDWWCHHWYATNYTGNGLVVTFSFDWPYYLVDLLHSKPWVFSHTSNSLLNSGGRGSNMFNTVKYTCRCVWEWLHYFDTKSKWEVGKVLRIMMGTRSFSTWQIYSL